MKLDHFLLFPFLALLGGLAVAADAPSPSIAKKGALIFSDDFDRTELGDKWHVTTPTIAIADGVLRCSQTKPEHGAVGRVDIGQKDLVLEFKFRFEGATNINAVCNDRAYKEGHAGHICRVSLSPRGIMLGDDKERLTKAIEEMQKDPARKAEVAKLTAGRTANFPVKLEEHRWYQLAMEVVDDELRVSLDGQPVGLLKSSGIAHPMKSDFHFTVSGNATQFALFDDVRVWAVGESKK
ncbi:MAG: hypothetical protein ABJF10_05265 [Chthoniobacter sp.]|uniref:hypothetical protein n=1 Tax=Chthoniobacter sp. TaxID=2510640 RepID=UPI0032ADBBC5